MSFTVIALVYQGRRASRCSALAPDGFHIPRLRRSSADSGAKQVLTLLCTALVRNGEQDPSDDNAVLAMQQQQA